MTFSVERIAEPGEFLAATADLQAREPYLTNVMASVAQSVASGERTYDSAWWWRITRQDTVVGMAMRTAPHALFLSPMADDAAAALGASVAVVDPTVAGIIGGVTAVDAVRAALAEHGGPTGGRPGRRDLVYVVERLEPATAPGRVRRATEDDVALLMRWRLEFAEDVGEMLSLPDEHAVRAGIAADRMWLWEDDGTPVAMAGHAIPAVVGGHSVARVGPVFTDRASRRRGYGGAVTSALTRRLLDGGHKVMLYADAANPTSNGVYRRIGYYQVAETVHWEFADEGS